MPWHRKTWSAGFSGFRDNLGKKVAEGKEEREKDCLKCSSKFVQSKESKSCSDLDKERLFTYVFVLVL